jgi:ATP-dependent DNA helicase RecQ
MTENDLQDVQERAIKRLGGVLDVQTMLPKEVKIGKKITTHLETYEYIQKGMTLDEIAQIRDLKPTTILSHLEKLLEEKKTMNLTPYRPEDE